MAPAVSDLARSPETIVGGGPDDQLGVDRRPAMSGLPDLPMRHDAAVADADVCTCTTPQWSSTIAFVMTSVQCVPSCAGAAVDWAIDSRIDLPPPKTDSSPPPERSSST